jgi:sec-independent protein translocase protein TatA
MGMHSVVPDVPILALFLGGGELCLIVALVLILFGAKKIPDLLRELRQGTSDFCKACKDVRDELDQGAFDAGKSLGGIHGKAAAEALTSDNQTAELYDPAVFRNRERVDRVAKGTVNRKSFFSRAALKFKRILDSVKQRVGIWLGALKQE